MEDKITYTFACLYPDDEECEYIPYLIPADEQDPKGYFESKTGERVYAFWKARIKDEVVRDR
jgi:hypothetical protein